ncbi:MAG TPA: glycosyltransferase [Bryobacteraceae bacterium]|nr:glycosyltransferase [Bryobacteraceae bacterium]
MARLLFTTFGSYGDLYPYLALGRELAWRGHTVTIATSEAYRGKVEADGLAFQAVRPDVSLDDRTLMEYLFDERMGSERVVRMICSVVRESYEDTLAAARSADLMVTHPISFAAIVAAQKLAMPWVSSVLSPISFFSTYDPPAMGPSFRLYRALCRLGPGILRRIFDLAQRQTLRWTQAVLELRKELGLPPGAHPLFAGSHSPSLVLALFSRCLAQPQLDWPEHTVITGFPFYDAPGRGLPDELARFLDAGPPPVVFTLGSSAVGAAGDFYRDSLKAVARLGKRAVFLTGAFRQNLPEQLPPTVIAVDYAAHSEVFPRAAAIIHQGGIGTTAQAIRAGRPMLIVPFGHDQFDNAQRVRRLGAGEVVARSHYNERRAESGLRRILEDPRHEQAAKTLAAIVKAENGCATAAQAIDGYLRQCSLA